MVTEEQAENDIAAELLVDTLEKLITRVQQRGIEGVVVSKRPCQGSTGCDAEHWSMEITIPRAVKAPPSTFVPAEAPSKPS